MIIRVALGLMVLVGVVARAADTVETLAIGAAAPDFNLPGVDGKDHALKDFAQAKLLLIVFTTNHCPTAQAYDQRLIDLHKDYAPKGVAVVAISPNDPLAVRLDELGYTDVTDDLESMKIRAKDRNFAFPYLYDGKTQSVSKAYGCQATPHVFLFDAERKLRYTGRIDDEQVKPPTKHDLRNALDALLAGKPVPVEKTKVFGCSTKWASKREEAAKSLAKWDAEPVELTEIDLAGIKALAKNDGQKLRVINVWATWCAPCTAELPELVAMNRMYRKRPFEMVTISLDDPEKKQLAHDKLKELKVATTNYLYKGDRDAMMTALDAKWEGPVPHTLIVAPGGKVIYRHTGQFDPLEVKRAIVGHLGRTYADK
ncbi:MAG: redoxin domain-containing protein [Phycisphaerae bacterium]|nr:redoxin domain-containing protein [Tepidisphaeraceae bacterium]